MAPRDPAAVPPRDPTAAPSSADETAAEVRRPVRCGACGATLTYAELRREVEGAHEHTFFNPSGLVYEIACFEDAEGTTAVGAATETFSWFAGWAWRVAYCTACHAHVGWRWERAGATFVGLVTSAIVRG